MMKRVGLFFVVFLLFVSFVSSSSLVESLTDSVDNVFSLITGNVVEKSCGEKYTYSNQGPYLKYACNRDTDCNYDTSNAVCADKTCEDKYNVKVQGLLSETQVSCYMDDDCEWDKVDKVCKEKTIIVRPIIVEEPCPDFNKDGKVNYDDFFVFVDNYRKGLTSGNSEFDLNNDGKIDGKDYTILRENFGKTCELEKECPDFRSVQPCKMAGCEWKLIPGGYYECAEKVEEPVEEPVERLIKEPVPVVPKPAPVTTQPVTTQPNTVNNRPFC